MEIINNYRKAEQALYDHVGFKGNWSLYPIEILNNVYWSIDDEYIYFQDEIFENCENAEYSSLIMKSNQYPNPIYKGEKYTMIIVNTQVDSNVLLTFFDNSKQVEQ